MKKNFPKNFPKNNFSCHDLLLDFQNKCKNRDLFTVKDINPPSGP